MGHSSEDSHCIAGICCTECSDVSHCYLAGKDDVQNTFCFRRYLGQETPRLRVRVRTGRTDPTHSTVCGHLLHRVWSMGPFRSESVSASKNGLSGRR